MENDKIQYLKEDNYYHNDKFVSFPLEKEVFKDKITLTKKPHAAVAKDWDKTVAAILVHTNNLKEQIKTFRNTDLQHVRTNLFVNAELADIVESHLYEIENRIIELEIDTKKIQHDYKNVEEDKQLETKQIA